MRPIDSRSRDQAIALATGLLPSKRANGAIIRNYLSWSLSAPPDARAAAAASLVSAYLRGDLDRVERADAETTLVALADDASPTVRLALAKALAETSGAPHVVLTALAADRSDIAAVVLGASPLFDAAELVDAVALGDTVVQVAVASRPRLPAGVAAALAEVGSVQACLTLCANPTADIGSAALGRMVRRFGHDAELREVLLARPDLDAVLRHDLVAATADALAQFVTACAWMSPDRTHRVIRDAKEQACVAIAADTAREDGPSGVVRLVAHLRASGRLTPALILRALLCGNLPLFDAALSSLSGLPPARVAGMARGAQGFAALYDRARLPASLFPAFQAAVAADRGSREALDGAGTTLQRARIRKVLTLCTELSAAQPVGGDLGKVVALLRRFDAEAARQDARGMMIEAVANRDGTSAAMLPRLTVEDRNLPLLTAA